MRLKRKIQAGALHYVIVVSIMVMILLMSFVSWIYIHKQLDTKSDRYRSALHYHHQMMPSLTKIPYNTPVDTSFSFDKDLSAKALKKRWGLFDLGIVSVQYHHEHVKKSALLGSSLFDSVAIYLSTQQMPLVMAGNASIIGNAYLSSMGIKTGNVGGVSFLGTELVRGSIYQSEATLPHLQTLEELSTFFNELFLKTTTTFPLNTQNIYQSFEEPTLVYASDDTLVLDAISLEGNIVIQSATEIIITSTAKLNHIICIAPKIKVLEGFQGRFQAIASASITIDTNVSLTYPSALTVLSEDTIAPYEDSSNGIHIQSNSKVSGVIVYHNNGKEMSYVPQIQIDANTQIIGQIYNTHTTLLRGQLYGSLYTNMMVAKEGGGVFINHLFDGAIDRTKLPPSFGGLIFQSSPLTVASWVE